MEPFPDNWSYLKAELNWLDRVLSVAVARRQKDRKAVEKVARSRLDRVTSHWWKGLVTLDGTAAYDSPAPQTKSGAKGSYHQQLEAKIQASQAQGIWLGLPVLQQQLHLSRFEKNLVLMALAPEVNRRYGRLYNLLQETEPTAGSLPTVDLILQILCRTDAEWRAARRSLSSTAPLIQQGVLTVQSTDFDALLARRVKLTEPLVAYLLAEQVEPDTLTELLAPVSLTPLDLPLTVWSPPTAAAADPWASLVLPPDLLTALRHLAARYQSPETLATWGFAPQTAGAVVLLTGPPGTGKTTAARAIAQALAQPLHCLDLCTTSPAANPLLLTQLEQTDPPVLLLQGATRWLQRACPLRAVLLPWCERRRQAGHLTLLTTTTPPQLPAAWRQQLDHVLAFSRPTLADRSRLWQQAFPATVALDYRVDWAALAQLDLTGGDIAAIARDAAMYAAQAQACRLSMRHLRQALAARHLSLPRASK